MSNPILLSQPALTDIDALAQIYSSGYASPHHITFTVDGLRNMIKEAIAQPAAVGAVEQDAKRYQWLRELPNADSLNVKYMGCDLDMIIDSEIAAIASKEVAK